MYLIGVDEAGFGPNLGPLVVGLSLWQVPGGAEPPDLYALLDGAVCSAGAARDAAGNGPLRVADSKLLYSRSSGLAALEQGVLAMLGTLHRLPDTWRRIWPRLTGAAAPSDEPWHAGFDCPLPVEGCAATVARHVDRLRAAFDARQARLLHLRCRAVFAREYNRHVARLDNKSQVLTGITLDLLADTLAQLRATLPAAPVAIYCDKHGGRDQYAGPVQHLAGSELIRIVRESAEESLYRFDQQGGWPAEIRFCQGGERHLPVALASMAAKYLRELAMRAFNQFWQRHVPALRPTAGYPQDARRFKAEIAAAQHELGIAEELLWRCR